MKFVAEDDKEFDNMEACIAHEDKLRRIKGIEEEVKEFVATRKLASESAAKREVTLIMNWILHDIEVHAERWEPCPF